MTKLRNWFLTKSLSMYKNTQIWLDFECNSITIRTCKSRMTYELSVNDGFIEEYYD